MPIVCKPTVYCKPGKVEELARMLPVDDCLQNQPETLAYYFFVPHKSPDTCLGFELYKSKQSMIDHGKAESFKTFGKASRDMISKPLEIALSAPVCGFITKDSESAEQVMSNRNCIVAQVDLTCKSAEHRTKLLEHAAKLIPKVQAEEGTLSYYWSADNKDPTKVYVFERYANQAARTAHGQNVASFLKDLRDLISSSSIETCTPVAGYLKKSAGLNNSKLVSDRSSRTNSTAAKTVVDLSFTDAKDGIPQSIAHRGYKALFPENTLIALEGALKSGAQGIETDVHLSRDGIVVIAHDADTLRCYAKPGNVWEKDYLGPSGMRTYVTVDEPHTHMPTLRDVLLVISAPEWRDKWCLLDIKVDNQLEIIQAMADTMRSVNSDMQYWSKRIVLGVWHHQYLPYCAKYLPELGITHIGLHTSYAERYFLHEPAVQSFNLNLYALVTSSQRDFVRRARKLGKGTYIWTVNDALSMRYCMKLNVDAILSDDPTKTNTVQNEDLSEWTVAEYWTFKRLVRGYAYNVFLFFVMLHRIFWTFRTIRNQKYIMPKEIMLKNE